VDKAFKFFLYEDAEFVKLGPALQSLLFRAIAKEAIEKKFCEACGSHFYATEADLAYCSDDCQNRAHWHRKHSPTRPARK
jgi:hypothetical protein